MSWNDSGGSNNQDPWSGKNRNQGPPDLDKILRDFSRKLSRMLSGKQSAGGGPSDPGFTQNFTLTLLVALVALIIVWVLSGIYIVSPEQEAVVLRFGKYEQTAEPGPHWVPRFIESYEKVNTQAIHAFQMQSDLLTKSSDQSDKPKPVVDVAKVEKAVALPTDPQLAKLSESDIDKNVVYVELGVQYRIGNPKDYLYSVDNAEQTIKQAAEAVLSQVVGTMKLDSVLTTGRSELSHRVLVKLREVLQQYKTGLNVLAVNVRKAQAPEEVADAFLEVAQAGQDGQRYKQQAEAYASKVVPLAKGNAARIEAAAKAYQQEIILNARADIAKYNALLSVYQRVPGVTRERMYLDTMQYVLTHSGKIMIDAKGSNNMFYLPLDKIMGGAQAVMPDAMPRAVRENGAESEVSAPRSSGRAPRLSYSSANDYLNRGN